MSCVRGQRLNISQHSTTREKTIKSIEAERSDFKTSEKRCGSFIRVRAKIRYAAAEPHIINGTKQSTNTNKLRSAKRCGSYVR